MSRASFVARTPLPLLPLRKGVVLPTVVTQLPIGRPKSRALFDAIRVGDRVVLAVQRDGRVEDPSTADLHESVVVAKVREKIERKGRAPVLVVEGLERGVLAERVQDEPYATHRVFEAVEVRANDVEAHALAHSLRNLVAETTPKESGAAGLLEAAGSPSRIADALVGFLDIDDAAKLRALETLDVVDRLRLASEALASARASFEIRQKVDAEVRRGITDQQKQALLRQQIRALQKELGDDEEEGNDELRKRLDAADLPEDVRKVAEREWKRLSAMPAQNAEAHVIRTYLDWILELPFAARAEGHIDLGTIDRTLEEDHHGLEEPKKRILEHMAVMRLTKQARGTILCLVGPPGVGKTSLAQSVARAIGRPLVRVSLGGVRDEAEIRGHRRTYVGALPGRVLHGFRKAKVKNPVVVLDEIDKMGRGIAGDPEAALLEVLDPEQNGHFVDHYLELPFDLSEAMFVATANDLSTLSPPLRDRLEILEISGYVEDDKLEIAKKHLVPKVLVDHGLDPERVTFDDDALSTLIRDYTREAGVRKARQELSRLARRIALEVAKNEADATVHVDRAAVLRHLGKPKVRHQSREAVDRAGVATGLAWTPVGGDVLFVETTRMPGKGRMEVTGQLGDVMKESTRTAIAWLRSHAAELGIDASIFESEDFHIHFPAGAVPKDGPSAGITILSAFASLLTGRRVRADTAMTGEATLRGRVLPVGGIESKVLAAERAGYTRLLLPKENRVDFEEVADNVRDRLEVHFVEDMRDVLELVLEPIPSAPAIDPESSSIGNAPA